MGSSENDAYDQELESILVGPVPVGSNEFVFQVSSRTSADTLIDLSPIHADGCT